MNVYVHPWGISEANCKNALHPFDGGAAYAFAGGGSICRTGSDRANICAFVNVNYRNQRSGVKRRCNRLGGGHERWRAGGDISAGTCWTTIPWDIRQTPRRYPAEQRWSRVLFTCSIGIKISRLALAKQTKRWFSDPLRWMNASSIVRLILLNHPFDNSAVCLDSTI